MQWKLSTTFAAVLALAVAMILTGTGVTAESADSWHMNGTAIEACSCPMFCQCYFSTEPAAHGGHGEGEHFCRFNMAYKVNDGHFGETDLTGVLFWIAGDLGSSWEDGVMDWAVLSFPPDVTEAQRAGVAAVLGNLFPVEWTSFEIGEDAEIEWMSDGERAEARLAGGDRGEMVLNKFVGMGGDHVVLHGMQYWGAPRNDGFVMMPNEVNAWHVGDKAFEFSGTNGFMITVDLSSEDMAK